MTVIASGVLPALSIPILVVTIFLGHAFFTILYRAYLHPLAHFPGPRFSAISYLHEIYWDVYKRGRFFHKIRDMHKQYGPIVRINPDELHILDPSAYDSLYVEKWAKHPPPALAVGAGAMAGTVSSALHKKRRAAFNPFFSKASINGRIGAVQNKVEKLCDRLTAANEKGEVVVLENAFTALVGDIISLLMFGESYDFLDIPEYAATFRDSITTGFEGFIFLRLFPLIRSIMTSIPQSLLAKFSPPADALLQLQRRSTLLLGKVLEERRALASTGEEPKIKPKLERTVFDDLLDSNLPPSELKTQRLTEEVATIMLAGSETTARSLSVIACHLLLPKNRSTRLKLLQSELELMMPSVADPLPTYAELERLPYLTAIIKEGMRLQNGTTSRLARTVGQPYQYKDWTVPQGAAISMSPADVLMDERVFPETDMFIPERWLLTTDNKPFKKTASLEDIKNTKINMPLDRYMVNFSKGDRSCLGMWLAWAELYVCTAAIFRRFEMELYETDESDVATDHDFFTAFSKWDSKGVRVKIANLRS